MKQILLICCLALAGSVFSQSIDHPQQGFSTVSNLKVTAIELTDSNTVLSFIYKGQPGTWILIPGGSCIQPVGTEQKYFATRTEGIPFGKEYWLDQSGSVEYSLFFPAIDPETERIDFREDNDGGSWFIYDIRLKNEKLVGTVPHELQNIWFAADGSKHMLIALYENLAVYQSRLWNVEKTTTEGTIHTLFLKNEKESLSLHFESLGEHQCKMGAQPDNLQPLNDWPNDLPDAPKVNNEAYSAPVFKKGPATYSGYIRDYTPRAGFKTGMVHVNNVFTGIQESYLLNIQENGYFTASFPMLYPQEVFLNIPGMHRTVFLEPGKETFQLIDAGSVYNGLLYQGEMALANNGLFELKDINYTNHWELRDTILKITPDQYKVYCDDIRERELKALNQTKKAKFISEKAYQVKLQNIQCRYIEQVLGYDMTYYSALSTKKGKDAKVSRDDVPVPDDAYYNFLTSEFINDPMLMLSNSYYFVVNRLKYARFLRGEQKGLGIEQLAAYVQSKGKILSDEELKMLEEQKMLKGMTDKLMIINEQYGELNKSFYEKHQELINELSKQDDFAFWHDIENILTEKGLVLTAEEKVMMEEARARIGRDEYLAFMKVSKTSAEAHRAFLQKYQQESGEYHRNERMNTRNQLLAEKLGISSGLIIDVMNAQDLLGNIVEELNPMEKEELLAASKSIQTPFIALYILDTNESTIKKIEELKASTGYVVHQVPKADSEQLFESMMEPFKGKVVFVDFWATWCGPCRSGMQQMKPLKESLKGQPIVFVYLTNETSPTGTWQNMVAEIGGEHFRLNKDEWNILSERFGVSGIPHYVLVDKTGKVAKNNGMSTWDSNGMKKLFEEFMAQ